MGNPIFGADSRLDSDTITLNVASSASFPSTNLFDDRIYTVCKTASSTDNFEIKTDTGAANSQAVDYFMMVGHDLSDPNSDGSGACTVSFAWSNDDATYTSLFSVTPTNNKIICRAFTQVTARYYRLGIVRGTNFIPSIGQLQWGQRVEAPYYGLPVGYDPQSETVKSSESVSQSGNVLGAVRHYSERKENIKLDLMPDSWIRGTSVSDFGYFWDNHASLMKPFLYAWNPGNPGSYETDAFFCKVEAGNMLGRKLRTPNAGGWRDVEFSVVGLKES